MTSAQDRAESMVQSLHSLCAAVADRDVMAVLTHFDDDCVFVDGTTGERAGSEGLVRFLEEMWALFPDFTPTVAATHTQGDTIGALFDTSGSSTDASTPALTRRPIRWMTVGFSTFDGQTGKIVKDVYFADVDAMEQLLTEPARAQHS